MKQAKSKRVRKERFSKVSAFDVILLVVLGAMALITLYPFYQVLIISVSNTVAYAQHPMYILPYAFDLTGYQTIFNDPSFYSALGVTIFVTVVGTTVNMVLSVSGAYVLSRKTLVGRNFFLGLILFTMLFNGGVIPTYLVVQGSGPGEQHLGDDIARCHQHLLPYYHEKLLWSPCPPACWRRRSWTVPMN